MRFQNALIHIKHLYTEIINLNIKMKDCKWESATL